MRKKKVTDNSIFFFCVLDKGCKHKTYKGFASLVNFHFSRRYLSTEIETERIPTKYL